MSQLDERTARHERLDIRDRCLKKAVQTAAGLDDISDAQQLARALNLIQSLSLLSIAITARDS